MQSIVLCPATLLAGRPALLVHTSTRPPGNNVVECAQQQQQYRPALPLPTALSILAQFAQKRRP
jgi:hypothetical protein